MGLGVLLVLRGARAPRPALAAALERLRPGFEDPSADAMFSGRLELEGARLGRRLATAMDRSGLRLASTRPDLAVSAKPLERFYLDKVLFAVVGFVLVPAFAGGMTLVGVKLPVIVPVWVSLLLGVGGFFLPDVLIRSEATERRRSFRHALSAFLELVRINLAGGAGIEGALYDAVNVGQGWAFAHLREALATARLSGETPWEALGRLGREEAWASTHPLGVSRPGKNPWAIGRSGARQTTRSSCRLRGAYRAPWDCRCRRTRAPRTPTFRCPWGIRRCPASSAVSKERKETQKCSLP